MTKLEIAKKTASIIVGLGTGTVTGGIIKNNVVPKNNLEKVTVFAAATVIGSMTSTATTAHTEAKIDELADWWKKNVKN